MKKIIEMKGINKYYSVGSVSLHALKDVSLEVEEGEFLAVLGPSGSGKSTLMNLVGCMDKPDSGEYFLDEIPIHAAKEKQLSRIRNEKIGFIFQKYHLISTYNVLQNIVMPLLMRGMTLREAEEASRDTIRMLWAWTNGFIISRGSFPGGSSREWPLPGLLWENLPCFWQTNLRERWTRQAAARCSVSFTVCMRWETPL